MSYSKRLGGIGGRERAGFEDESVAACEFGREKGCRCSRIKVVFEGELDIFVSLFSLRHYDIEDIVLEADFVCFFRNHLVDRLRKYVDIVFAIVFNAFYKTQILLIADGFLELFNVRRRSLVESS